MHFKISSAICFNLDQSKILSSGNGDKVLTTLFQVLSTLTKKAFENIVKKEENSGSQHFLVFHYRNKK